MLFLAIVTKSIAAEACSYEVRCDSRRGGGRLFDRLLSEEAPSGVMLFLTIVAKSIASEDCSYEVRCDRLPLRCSPTDCGGDGARRA